MVIDEKERELRQNVDEIDQLERQLGCVNQQLEESEQVNAQFQRRIAELEQLRPGTDTSSSSKEQRASIKLIWNEGEIAPLTMSSSHCAAVDGSTLYARALNQIYSYTINTSSWSQLPDCPTSYCPSVIINNLLTLVGGNYGGAITNQLFSLTGEDNNRRWTEEFPPMPKKRWGSTVLCTGTALIVAGGVDKDGSTLQTVEVLNNETKQWSTAADLPKPMFEVPAAVCGDCIYIPEKSNMYTCSIQTLIQTCKSFLASIRNRGVRVWKEVAAPPVTLTTCVSIHGRLLAIGGRDLDTERPISAVHMYNPTTNSWEINSYMETPRYDCIAAVLPNNLLMVVGGATEIGITDSIQFASVE